MIFSLSLFGLAMAVATVFVILSNPDPILWLVIFVVCTVVIAQKQASRQFLHGLLVGIVNATHDFLSELCLADLACV